MAKRDSSAAEESLIIEHIQAEGETYRDRIVAEFSATQSTFDSCDFSGMTMHRACFGSGGFRSIYRDCVFDDSDITARSPGIARFERCSFLNVRFAELNCRNVEFVDCTFSGTIHKGYFFGSAPPSEDCDIAVSLAFSGNDFSRARLVDVGFRLGVDLTNQKLPSGPQYIYGDDVQALASRLEAIAQRHDEDTKMAASILQSMVVRDLNRGQMQIFLSSEGFPSGFKKVFALLRATLSPVN